MHGFVLGEFFNIGSSELVLIIFVALLLFGGEQLPKIARGLGKGIRDFKDASEGVKREINEQINNYEEKREEDKRVEEAIKARQESASQLPAHGFTPVENTIPLNDNYTPVEHTEKPEGEHTGTVAEEHHTPAAGNETHSAETIKNI